MPKVEFTTDQKKVIDAPVCDLLVSAAAGSGKTAVLVERIMNRICDRENPVDIDKILIVTFTRNAAASMKERIYRTLEKRCGQEPENRYLAAQLSKICYADITTIDSFCLKTVKNYFYAADIEPNFRIADANEADILLYDAIGDVLEKEYERGESGFIRFMSVYGGAKNDDEIIELLKKLIRTSASYPWQRVYINHLDELYLPDSEEEFNASEFAGEILDYSKLVIGDCVDIISKAYALSLTDEALRKYSECLDSDLLYLKSLLHAESCSGFRKLLQEGAFRRAPSIEKGTADENTLASVKKLRDKMRELVKKLTSEYYSVDVKQIIKDNEVIRPYIRTLAELTCKVLDRFEELKKSRNMMEFSDVTHAVLDILVKRNADGSITATEYAEELRRKYDEIMIDEYQDSNYIQEVILSSISGRSKGEPNVFMVGDVKQSIYKFRMAKPELFMEKYASYGRGDDKSLIIDLKKNFRSSGCVIHTVNDVFSHIMTEKTCGIAYDENAALNQGADYGELEAPEYAASEFHVIDACGAAGEDKYVLTAAAIAERIKELMQSGMQVMRDKTPDRLRFGDIVILVRYMTGSASVLANRLPDEGIPACVNTTAGYFKTTEVTLMLNYLRILDNPYQDIELAAVLRSYCGGLTDEELAYIKIFDKSVNEEASYLFEAAKAYMDSEEAEPECRKKLSDFFAVYEKIRFLSAFSGIYEVLLSIYENTGYYRYVSILPAGNIRKANLDMLLVKAGDYEKTDFTGVNSFLRYVDKLIRYEIDTGEANAYEGTDAVRIMTIHASKGLEYPVVILADTERQFNSLDEKSAFVLHSDKGIGFKAVNGENNSYHKSIQKRFLSGLIHRESIAEEIRVLYVAMTRAKQKMLLFASISDTEKAMDKWNTEARTADATLSYSYVSQASCYADLLAPVFLLHADCFEREHFEKDGRIRAADFLIFDIIGRDSLLESISKKLITEQERTFPEGTETDTFEKIKAYFDYRYPYESESIPVKFSVSELKHKAMEESEIAMENASLITAVGADEAVGEAEPAAPAFITGKAAEPESGRGAVLGTLTHMLMQKIVREKAVSFREVKAFTEEKIAAGEFPEEMKAVELKKVSAFLGSETGKRIRAAADRGELYIEQPFVIGIPACEANERYKSRETVLVQGIIDVFFIENGEAVLLDYKTDRVRAESGEAVLKERYRRQLELYAEAIEKIKKISVKSKIIYSFSLEKEIYL